MDKRIKRRWVEALRSGKYEQTRGLLGQKDGGYCCLGVLCDITPRISERKWADPYDTGNLQLVVPGESRETYVHDAGLPFRLLERYGMSSDEEGTLIELNDSGTSFSFIADHIEREL